MSVFLKVKNRQGEEQTLKLEFEHEPLNVIPYTSVSKKGKLIPKYKVMPRTCTSTILVMPPLVEGQEPPKRAAAKIIATGKSVCQPEDAYEKNFGRLYSLARAVKVADLPDESKTDVLISYASRRGELDSFELDVLRGILTTNIGE